MVNFEPNYEGLKKAMTSTEAKNAWQDIMDLVTTGAIVRSPVITGHYKASWHNDVSTESGELVGTLMNDANYAIYVEHGNSNGAPAQHIAENAAIETLRSM